MPLTWAIKGHEIPRGNVGVLNLNMKKNSVFLLRWIAGLVFVLSLGGTLAIGQSTFGTILGTVKDSSGALMPGIAITIENAGTALRRSALADESAAYSFPNLEPGEPLDVLCYSTILEKLL